MDALPFVAAVHQIAVGGKLSLFQLGDMASEPVRVNPSFPFLRHFHHAGFMQVVIAQRGRGFDARQVDKVFHVVGVVDDLADTGKFLMGPCQGGVQLCDLGGGQRFQTGRQIVQLVHVCGQHQIVGQGQPLIFGGGIAIDEKVLRVVGGNTNLTHGFL